MSISRLEPRRRWVASNGFQLLLIVVLAAMMRLPALDRWPPPLNQDEASRLYDAWSLLETGADRHGERWPFFLKSFGEGDYTAALTTYMTIPFVALFGPTARAVRLPDALCGVLTVWLVFLLVRRTIGDGAGLVAALILALDPWHVTLCRTGHEAGYAPVFLAAALYAGVRAGLIHDRGAGEMRDERNGSCGWAALSGFMFGLHAWVHPATRLFTPMFLLSLLFLFGRRWPWREKEFKRAIGMAMAGLLFATAPLWITAVGHPERIAARARVALWAQPADEVPNIPLAFIKNYASSFSLAYGFVRFEEMSGVTLDGVGLHLIVSAPLWLIGLAVTVARCRSGAWPRLLIAWVLLSPVPAAICVDWNPHPFRAVGGMLLYPILAATGWQWLANRVSRIGGKRLVVGGIAAIFANACYFAHVYVRRSAVPLEAGHQTGVVRAMQFVGQTGKDADFVLVTRWFTQPYIYALVYVPIEPSELAALPRISGNDAKGFHQVNQIGKYFFPPRQPEKTPELTARFQKAFASLPADAQGLVIELEGRFPGGEVIASFPNGNGPAVEVRRWRPSDSK